MQLLLLALVVGLVAVACGPEEKTTVVLIEQDWDGQLVTTALAKLILEEEMGYTVETRFAPADSQQMFQGLTSGEMHFSCCVWPSFSASLIDEFVDTKKTVERMGPNGINGTSHWYVPRYVVEGDSARNIAAVAPELKSYKDMNKYASVFATADTGSKGRLLDFTPAWDYRNQERLDALGVNFEVKYTGSETAGFAELDASYKRGEPVLLVVWTPHWSVSKYDLVPVVLPPHQGECYNAGDDVSVAKFDCGFPIDPVTKFAWPKLAQEIPEVYEFLSSFTVTNDQQQDMVLSKVEGGKTDAEVAKEWKDANEGVWKPWIPR